MQVLPLQSLRAFEAAARTGSFRGAATALGLTPKCGQPRDPRAGKAHRGVALPARRALRAAHGRRGDTDRLCRAGFAELRTGLEGVAARAARRRSFACIARRVSPRNGWCRVCRDYWRSARGSRCGSRPASTTAASSPANSMRMSSMAARPRDYYGTPGHEGVEVMPLCRERITPLCNPEMARHITAPGDLLSQRLIESENKKVRWREWFQANGLTAPPPRGSRFDRSFIAISAAADGLGVALGIDAARGTRVANGAVGLPLARPVGGRDLYRSFPGLPEIAAPSARLPAVPPIGSGRSLVWTGQCYDGDRQLTRRN